MGVEIVRKSTNKSKLTALVDTIRLKNPSLKVGFFNKKIASIAAWNEFGVHIKITDKMRGFFLYEFKIKLKPDTEYITIPPRPFMQMTVDKHRQEWVEKMQKLAKKYDYNLEKVFNRMGEVVKQDIQNMITNGDFVENSALTIKNKGDRNKPLFDTGAMRDSVSYDVSLGG